MSVGTRTHTKERVLGLVGRGANILGGSRDSWDVLTTYSWAYNPPSNLPNWPHMGYPDYSSCDERNCKWLLSPMGLQVLTST